MTRLVFLFAFVGLACSPADSPDDYTPSPGDDQIEVTEECARACQRLAELRCEGHETCKAWLCAADFQDYEAIAQARSCPE